MKVDMDLIRNILYRPIGLPRHLPRGEARNWICEKDPHPLMRTSCVAAGGVTLSVVALMTTLVSMKNDSNFGRWLGGIMGTLGFGALGAGVFDDDSLSLLHSGEELQEKREPGVGEVASQEEFELEVPSGFYRLGMVGDGYAEDRRITQVVPLAADGFY